MLSRRPAVPISRFCAAQKRAVRWVADIALPAGQHTRLSSKRHLVLDVTSASGGSISHPVAPPAPPPTSRPAPQAGSHLASHPPQWMQYQSRWQRSGDGDDGGGKRQVTSTIELPVFALAIAVAASLFWVTTRHHTLMKNEVAFQEFIDDFLNAGLVERLEVVNKQFVRVVLKEPVVLKPSMPSRSRSRWSIVHSRFSHSLVAALRDRFSNWKPPTQCRVASVCFEVGDVNQLESLVHQAVQRNLAADLLSQTIVWVCRRASAHETLFSSRWKLPPIYYTEETDYVQLLRQNVPAVLMASLAFASFTQIISRQAADPGGMPGGSSDGAFSSSTFGTNGTQSMNSHDRILRFGKATPVLGHGVAKVTFADIAGLEQAKKEVSEFVEFLKKPGKFIDLGAEIPKGALLVGPPGTGKTLLARAVAGEANVPFYSMSGSDFIELFVGVGPSRIRDLFDRARRNAPAIVFIDEIDTIGRSRAAPGAVGTGGSDERESTLNALLVELDGFTTTRSGVIVLGGTNRGDVLDPALTRPGRFDRRIALGKPSVKERKDIFDIHLRPIRLDIDHDPSEVAKRLAALTPGLSGAEIKSVCNEAAIIAARQDAPGVTLDHLEQSVERLVGGLKNTGEVLTQDMKRHVALHEAGHAVAGWFLRHADPVLKLSIVPRASGSLGYTQLLPDELLLAPKEELTARICVLLGGRASEVLFADSITTGAADDLHKATKLAYSYVANLGFDSHVGLVAFNRNTHGYGRPYSESTAELIDRRVQEIIAEQWDRVCALLKHKEEKVKAVADLLLEKETVSFSDLRELLGDPPRAIRDAVRQYVEALPSRQPAAAGN